MENSIKKIKNVSIRDYVNKKNINYVVVEFKNNNKKLVGTIEESNIINGRLKKELRLIDLVAKEKVSEAIEERQKLFILNYLCKNYSLSDAMCKMYSNDYNVEEFI